MLMQCKAQYQLPDQQQGSSSRLSAPQRLLSSLNAALFDAAYATSWPGLAMKLWRSYIMAQGITQVGNTVTAWHLSAAHQGCAGPVPRTPESGFCGIVTLAAKNKGARGGQIKPVNPVTILTLAQHSKR